MCCFLSESPCWSQWVQASWIPSLFSWVFLISPFISYLILYWHAWLRTHSSFAFNELLVSGQHDYFVWTILLKFSKSIYFFLYVFLFVICYDYTRDSICNILRVNILRLIKTELLLRRPEVYRSKMLNLKVVDAWFKIPLLENGLLLYGRKNNFSSILLGFWLQAPPDVIKYIIKRKKQIEV